LCSSFHYNGHIGDGQCKLGLNYKVQLIVFLGFSLSFYAASSAGFSSAAGAAASPSVAAAAAGSSVFSAAASG